MKWIKLVVVILGALVGAFLIWWGWLIWSVYGYLDKDRRAASIALFVGGGVVFLCSLRFHRQIARSLQRVGKYLWATKYWRGGLILSMVIIVAVGTLLAVRAQHRKTLNVLQYNGHAWGRMSSGTSEHLRGVWGSSSSDVFAVGRGPRK